MEGKHGAISRFSGTTKVGFAVKTQQLHHFQKKGQAGLAGAKMRQAAPTTT